jgi:hypothetical protein
VKPPHVGPVSLRERGDSEEHLEIAPNHRVHAGPQDFDDDVLAARQARRVDLRDRRCRKRLLVELGEHLGERPAERALEGFYRKRRGERRDLVLQLRELVGKIGGQEITAYGDALAEFDEQRPKLFEGESDARTERGRRAAPRDQAVKPGERPKQMDADDELVEPVAYEGTLNAE